MKVLPRPHKIEKLAGEFIIDEQTKVFCSPEFKDIAQKFVDMVKASCGLELQFAQSVEDAHVNFVMEQGFDKEWYTLNIAQGCLTATASSPNGCFYALQSLIQILQLFLPQEKICCVNYYVVDSPKYAYRGLLLDICRHFYGVEVIKQIITLMSQVKLNKLHLHLSDDQGFRVQIDSYPKLTEVGSMRAGTEVVRDGKRFVEEVSHGGCLTKQDVADIVAFANEHFVEIIPEIDIPGHMVAGLTAYPEFSCTGNVSEVRKNWGISKDLLCAGNEESYQFVCDILDEICQMFPSEYIHLGGDETPKERWCNCKKCREKLAELKFDNYEQLQNYMLEFFATYLEQQGKKVIAWNDGIQSYTSDSIISQVWKPFTRNQGAKDANNGRQVIMSPFFYNYFDYPYAMTPLKKTLHFNPAKGIKNKHLDNLLGVEGCLWTEYIGNTDKLYFNLLPRLDALATVAWGRSTKEFSQRLQTRYALYQQMGITYNSRAFKQRTKLCVVKKFWKQDADVEVVNHKKYLEKHQK